MKNLCLVVLLLFGFQFVAYSQLISLFHEDFELPSLCDSLTNSSTPTAGYGFSINTRLHTGATSLRSDSCQVKQGNTVYMTSPPFSTVGYSTISLVFNQICKIDFVDVATIEVSGNNGTSWTQLTGAQYQGTGYYASNGNKFASNSYGAFWSPGTPSALPQNTWWKGETFDLSALLANCSNARFRFKLTDAGAPGPNNNKGWYIDNVKIQVAANELIPPAITLVTPILSGSIQHGGPYPIKAKITDNSGIDSARLIYTVNNGVADTIGMLHQGSDTMVGIIPMMIDSAVICWYVDAFDASPAGNWARNPVSSCNSFTVYTGLMLPYSENFDGASNLWTPSWGGSTQTSSWELGSPTYGQTNTTHSPPLCWDVNLAVPYGYGAYCILTSPAFQFQNVVDATLSFWLNYHTEANYDGTRLEYSLDGNTWNLLGNVNDSLGENWYNGSFWNTGIPSWFGSSNGWVRCKYSLSAFNNLTTAVRFRFVFLSDGSGISSGVSIDDFSLIGKINQDVDLTALIQPDTGCGLVQEVVRIRLKNIGIQAINGGLTASYKLANQPPVTEIVPGIIQLGDSLEFTFSIPVDLSVSSADSLFQLRAWADLAGDLNHEGDSLGKQILSKYSPPALVSANYYVNYGQNIQLVHSSGFPVRWYDSSAGGTLVGSDTVYNTQLLYAPTVYYACQVGPNGCESNRVADTVFISQPPMVEAGIEEISSPVTGINLGSTEPLTVRVRNYGLQPLSGIQVSYTLNQGATVTESIAGPLMPGAWLIHSFALPLNLSVHQQYPLNVWITLAGDTVHSNDTLSVIVSNNLYDYCESAGIDGLQINIGNLKISNISNGVATPVYFNPATTQTYTDYTFTQEPIWLIRGKTYRVKISPIFHTTAWDHYCKIFIDWNYDGILDAATETAFSSYSQDSNQHLGAITIPLTAALGSTLLRVSISEHWGNIQPCGAIPIGETEDYQCFIYPQCDHDAAVVTLASPPPASAQGYPYPVEVVIKNVGTQPILNASVGYRVDNQTPVVQTYTGNLPAFATDTVSFPPVSLPAGVHELCTWINLSGDTIPEDDTLYSQLLRIAPQSLPFYDNMDQGSSAMTTTVSGTTNWMVGSPTSLIWPWTSHSLPNVWCTNFNLGGYQNSADCSLETPNFDFSTITDAVLSFWSTHYIYDYPNDAVVVYYSTDNGVSWTRLGALIDPLGYNWYNCILNNQEQFGFSSYTSGWKWSRYRLTALNNQPLVKFRFRFFSDYTSTTSLGFALDDIRIGQQSPSDAGIVSIISPPDNGGVGASYPVTVTIHNYGAAPLSSMNISYVLDGQAPVTLAWTGLVLPDSSAVVSFPNILISGSSHTIIAYTTMPGDDVHENDTTGRNYNCQIVLSDFTNLHAWIQDKVVGLQGTVSNVTTIGSSLASGTYTTGCEELGLSEGVLLTTGSKEIALGPNTSQSEGIDNGFTASDPDLSMLATGTIRNPYTLEFDVVPTSNVLAFRYLFGSEEYYEYVNSSFNDVFGIFISGPGIAGPFTNGAENMALIPGTNIPVSINTVNNGYNNAGPCENCEWLVYNGGGQIIEYDGYTRNLMASHSVIPGQTYHVKIVIADITDATYDSGVFIEEGDVIHHAVTPVVAYHHNSGQNNTGESTIEGCSHATVMFYRNFTGTDTLVVVIDSVAGSATSGVDYQSVPDSVLILPNQTFAQFDIQPFYDGIQEGNEMIKITVLTSLDGSTDTTLQIPVLDYKNISITAISDSVMGNTQNQVQLWVNASFGLPPYLFTWSPESTLDNAFLQNPTATPLQNTWYSIFVEDSVQCSSASDSVLVSLSGCSTLQGSITYLNDLSTPLNNTEVVLSLNTVPVGNDFSDSGGEYYIPGICPAGDYQLHLTSSKPWSGGNAVDALLIVKKFVGLVSFNPLQNKAADVDQSGLANSVDAMLVMRRFVGQITSFVTGDWAFEDGTVSIPSASVLQHDIKGTCYGDINGSYYPAFKQEYSVSLSNNDMLIHADPSDFDIPISVTEDVVPGSFSLVLELPDDGIHISDVVTDAGGTLVYQQDRKALRIAWYRVDPVTLHAGDILFQMHCRYDQTIPLTAAGWLCGPESQVTDGNGIPYGNFRLTMPGILFGGSEFYVGQNAPNPFSGESEIPCYFPEKGRVSLRITDITGRQAGSVIISEQEKGFHYFTVHARDLIPGIYNYTLEFEGKTREQSKTFKMVICK